MTTLHCLLDSLEVQILTSGKLSTIQLDKNSVFINSAPEAILNLTEKALLDHINEANSNIQAIGAYVPPKRGHLQKLWLVKLTVLTRNMVN